MSILLRKQKIHTHFTSADFVVLIVLSLFIYGLIGVAEEWTGPYQPESEISLDFASLLQYSLFSLTRVCAAYLLSLTFTFTYGYFAAKSRRLEPLLISVLDILQSVPVLSFMPGLVLAMVKLFPHSNLGLEVATILMVFTCEGWNMVFSFYSSVKSVPAEYKEVSRLYRLTLFEKFRMIELPISLNGLIWNSMLSMAGGWFYLTVMESFSLGENNFRLPGIGSYMSVAYERNDWSAVILGLMVMFSLIILVDRCLWAPLIAWSERYRFDPVQPHVNARSALFEWIKRSQILAWTFKRDLKPRTRLSLGAPLSRLAQNPRVVAVIKNIGIFLAVLLGVIFFIYTSRASYHLLEGVTWRNWAGYLLDTFYTFLRVFIAVLAGSLWTVPLGVFIGTQPKLARALQPLVQIVASFPFPMIFPLLTLGLLKLGISFNVVAVVLMLFASQWYIFFNVISGAQQIPSSLMEVKHIFRLRSLDFWRSVILPSIFPSLVNGWITAAGGAWNSCIVAEIFAHQGNFWTAKGVGATINLATQTGNFSTLAGATVTMVLVVVLLNRLFWGNLYRLAENKYKLES